MRVSVSAGRRDIAVEFADSGRGIAPEMRGVIFEKFARASPAQAGSAGLGLPICRQTMTRLGGEVTHVAARPGTVFRLRVPKEYGNRIRP